MEVIAHRRRSGDCPYDDFLHSVEQTGQRKDLAKVLALVRKLSEEGYRLTMTPLARQVQGDLGELKPGAYRLFYSWEGREQAYVLLNGYRKKSERTPERELQRALELMHEHKSEAMQRRQHE